MQVAVASDHGGFKLKQEVMSFLAQEGIPYKDFGTFSEDSTDYPDFALPVAQAVRAGEFQRGILCCGTGIGVSIVANKVPGVRAALCHDTFSARASREHNDANVLAMGQRVVGLGLALDIVKIWLGTSFQGDRHARRLQKISAIEDEYCPGGREEKK